MRTAPEGHGYIDHVGGQEHFWRIETLWGRRRGPGGGGDAAGRAALA